RIEAGRIDAVYEATDLAALTRDLASVFRSAIERAGLRLVVDCPPLDALVYVDREMWEKIVLNLVSNAFKFTFGGEIAITLHASGDAVELRVRDTGCGIAPDELPHVFERFHRIRDARARTHEGTGIGLALVQELARLHGGTVSAESVVGAGTTISVRVPTGSAHLPADRVRTTRTQPSMTSSAKAFVDEALGWLSDGTVASQAGRPVPHAVRHEVLGPEHARILVVDDNADMRDYLARLLGERWVVDTVGDGTSALAAVLARRPDLVITDVMIPGLDGFGLLRSLRGTES